MNPSRILALDLGKRRIGLALSDELGISAQGLETLERTNIREDLARLSQLVVERGVTLILIGNPLHMSGREGRQAGHAREFGERLKSATGLPVEFWDERLTTVEAQRVLREPRSWAAVSILQAGSHTTLPLTAPTKLSTRSFVFA